MLRAWGTEGMASESTVGPTIRALSAYLAEAPRRELPAEVAEKGKHHLLDTLAAMVSGSRLPPGLMAIAYVQTQGGVPEALVVGSRVVTSAVNAALAGGMLAHADETDDSHAPSFSHPGCAVVPAALAMAERDNRTGLELLRAVVLGYDVGCRATQALGPRAIYRAGRSSHSLAGVFGAAAAAGALAGLDADQARWLLSYTAQQASGIATWARDEEHVEKAFDFGGMPARNGVAAATTVAAGFTGVADAFSGERSFFDAFAAEPDPAEMARGLGERFEIMRANIKKWSVGSPIQAALDSLGALIEEHGLGPDDVARITVRLPDAEAHIVDRRSMPDINLQHLLAVMLIDRGLTFASSHDIERMRDPAVVALTGRMMLIADAELGAEMPRRQAILEMVTRDGGTLSHRTRAVRGTADNPMTREEVEAKALDLIVPVTGDKRARELIDRIWNLENLKNARELRPLLEI
jgi:2-methylcitrate dehydratase PrpD